MVLKPPQTSDLWLFDCGEGTQVQLRKQKISLLKINHIFISHLHGDHYFGLIGLVNSMHLLGRTKELNIYAPKGMTAIIDVQLNAANARQGSAAAAAKRLKRVAAAALQRAVCRTWAQ